MRNQGQLFIGALLILFGGLLLASNVLHFNFWAVCWPGGLIIIGLWIAIRPRMLPDNTLFDYRIIGDIRRTGAWQVVNEEFWTLIGDTRLDMTEAEIPLGETRLRAYGFVGDLKLYLPSDLGVSLNSQGLINQVKINGQKQEHFFVPLEYTSEGYETAERRIRLETSYFINDIKIQQS